MIETKIKIIQNKTNSICQYFRKLVNENELIYRTGYDKLKVLSELDNIEKQIFKNANITIAFVGEYNAGKTTLINILTNNNLSISAKPETSQSIKIPWNNYTIIDTPGLGSGNPDHDNQTEQWLAGADLLIYVLTPDLFNQFAGRRFHDILKKYNRKQELMLVMNMIDQEDNDIDVFYEELQNVIDPTPLEDYYPTFISAKYYLQSIKTDDVGDKKYYEEKSNFNTLLETLDNFLLNKEQKSRLTTPLTKLYALSQVIEFNSEFNKEIELLNLKIQFFNETTKTINTISKEFEGNLNTDVLQVSGNIYAALDDPPKDFKQYLEDEFNKFSKTITKRIDYLTEQTNLILQDFEEENAKIDNSNLSKEVEERIQQSSRLKEIFKSSQNFHFKKEDTEKINFIDELKIKAEDIDKKLKKAGVENNVASSILQGNFKELSTKLITKIDKKLVLDVGHKLGYKFKPWEAVKLTGKVTKGIAKAVPFVNIAVAVWDISAHFYRKNKENEAERKLREFKENIRENLNNAINETTKVVNKELINPLITNLDILKLLHYDKKKELMKFSIQNKELVSELENKRQLCLDTHDEIYDN